MESTKAYKPSPKDIEKAIVKLDNFDIYKAFTGPDLNEGKIGLSFAGFVLIKKDTYLAKEMPFFFMEKMFGSCISFVMGAPSAPVETWRIEKENFPNKKVKKTEYFIFIQGGPYHKDFSCNIGDKTFYKNVIGVVDQSLSINSEVNFIIFLSKRNLI